MVKNMLFLDSVHARMGRMILPPPRKKKLVCLFMFYAWFKKIIKLVYTFLIAAIVRYAANFYK